MGSKTTNKVLQATFICPILIFFVWLLTYVLTQLFIEQKLGWDEIAYMSVAKGIAEDFDFSARAYTIMGILKQGYPSHLINFPIYQIYLAVFFKLFGPTREVAYFCNWFTGLAVCFLIYFIFLLLYEKSYKAAFIVAISYLFLPGIIKNCDSGMMEQTGCLLLCLSVFFILQDYVKGKFNFFTVLKFSISILILYMYKSLYIGYFFGAFVFILLAYSPRITGSKIKTQIPLPLFLFLSFGTFALLFYVLEKYLFYPVSPMMTFSPVQEFTQVYADFLGGYFNNFLENFLKNVDYFFKVIVAPYFVYPAGYLQYTSEILSTTAYFIALGVYYFLLFIIVTLSFAYWKKLSGAIRLFLCFSFISILSFNLIFNFLLMSYHSNIWRYNVYYFPLYLISLGIIVKSSLDYIKPFVTDNPKASKVLLSIVLIFGYFPLFLSMIVHYVYLEEWYHQTAKTNAEIVRSFLKGASPKFIYFNHGTHTTFSDYPVRQVFKDATNEQLLKVNKILPEPIEFLFLRPNDWLFKNNQELILMGAPILNDQYKLYGFNKDAQVVVYRSNKPI